MPKLKKLSGKDVAAIFLKLGFAVVGQKGSHIKLRRVTAETKQTLLISNHRELDIGTCKAIFNQALRYIPDAELRAYFYTR